MNLYKNSDNTHEIYGRNNTRSFDTDNSKDGFERVETYHRDVYGRSYRADIDVLGDAKNINGYTLYSHNIYGKETERKTYTDDKFTEGKSTEYNHYEYKTKESFFTSDPNNPARINEYEEKNAYGQDVHIFLDKDASGNWTHADVRYKYTVDPLSGLRLTNETVTNVNGKDKIEYLRYIRDDFNREIIIHYDDDRDAHINGTERNDHLTYHNGLRETYKKYHGDPKEPNNLQQTDVYLYDEANRGLGGIVETKTKVYTHFNGIAGVRTNAVEDLTSDNWQAKFKPFEHRMQEITLSEARAKTDITLDKAVITALTDSNSKKLVINGDATDTVRIKALDTMFEASTDVKASNQTYKQYTTMVENDQYTLLIDSDINIVNLG